MDSNTWGGEPRNDATEQPKKLGMLTVKILDLEEFRALMAQIEDARAKDQQRITLLDADNRGLRRLTDELLNLATDQREKKERAEKERDQFRDEKTAYRDNFERAVDACRFMQDEAESEKIGLELGEQITSTGVRKLRANRDELEKRVFELETEVAEFKANNRYHRGYGAGYKDGKQEGGK